MQITHRVMADNEPIGNLSIALYLLNKITNKAYIIETHENGYVLKCDDYESPERNNDDIHFELTCRIIEAILDEPVDRYAMDRTTDSIVFNYENTLNPPKNLLVLLRAYNSYTGEHSKLYKDESRTNVLGYEIMDIHGGETRRRYNDDIVAYLLEQLFLKSLWK